MILVLTSLLGRGSIDIGVYERLLLVILQLLANDWLAWLAHLGLITIYYGLAIHVVHGGFHWNTLSWHCIKSGHCLTILPQVGHLSHLLLLRHAFDALRWSCCHRNLISTHNDHLGLSSAWVLHHNHLMLTANHLSLACVVRLLLSSDLLRALTIISFNDGQLVL